MYHSDYVTTYKMCLVSVLVKLKCGQVGVVTIPTLNTIGQTVFSAMVDRFVMLEGRGGWQKDFTNATRDPLVSY